MPDDIIDKRTALRLIGGDLERFRRLLSIGRHHHDDRGDPYWLRDEWEETLGLEEAERRGRGSQDATPGCPA
jgi:hypothetical protein